MKNNKYRPGQVVILKRTKSPVQLYKKGGLPFIDSGGYAYIYNAVEGWVHISEIRPLTHREKGEK